MSRVVLPEPGLETRFSTSWLFAAKRGCAPPGRLFLSSIDFDFHPPLALARRVGTGFAVAMSQIALRAAGRGEVIGFHAGDGHGLARWGRRGAAKRRVRVMFIAFDIKVAFSAAAPRHIIFALPILNAESAASSATICNWSLSRCGRRRTC